MSLNVEEIRKDFPILSRQINGKDLVYLDNAATSQKPRAVIDAVTDYYTQRNANVHRGVHTLSDEATEIFESTRKKVSEFIGAKSEREIIFTKGTTESINMVAESWGKQNLKEGDVILLTEAEHNSNLLPWLKVAEFTGAEISFLELNESGELTAEEISKKVTDKVKLTAISHVSNVLGTIFPVTEICKKTSGVVVVDGAQAVPHMPVNVQKLGCDFYAFSGHKMLGPMGTGVLWIKEKYLEELYPSHLGGGSVVGIEKLTPLLTEVPQRFEAGTPNVAGAAGLHKAIEYLEKLGMENVSRHEKELTEYALAKLVQIPGLKILGAQSTENRVGVISFVLDEVHPHDLGTILNTEGIAARTGQHCAMKLHDKLNLNSSTRASFYIYNTQKEIDTLIKGIEKALEILG